MRALLRGLLRIKPPRVSKDEALEVARRHCADREWSWKEPVRITEGLREYVIRTNAEAIGGNAWIAVSIHSGEVIRSSFAPR
jgi:hypothetical protein